MKTAKFDPTGGPIKVDIKAGQAQPGTYILVLWETNSNIEIQRWSGNFINTDDDSYFLPKPTEKHDGRLINCGAVFTLLPPSNNFHLEVVVSQDGNELEREIRAGQSDLMSVPVEIFIELKRN